MVLENKKFIVLSNDSTKTPSHSLDEWSDYESEKRKRNLAILVEAPYIVLDIDDKEHYDTMLEIVTTENIQCDVMETTRGGHFWFKSDTPLTNSVNISTPITMKVDVRSYGKKSYVKVRDDGRWRKWVREVEEVEHLPRWLEPFRNNRFDFMGARNGDGRNDELFRYIIDLTNRGYTREEIQEVYRIINDYIFRDKLGEKELNTILRDDSFINIRPAFFDKNRFKHDTFANFFKNDNSIYRKHGLLYIYNDGYYDNDLLEIEASMLRYIPELTRTQRQEVMDYVRLIADEPKDMPMYYVSTMNGILDIRDHTLMPFSEEYFIANKINAMYDPSVREHDEMDNFLDRITCNDKEIRKLLIEMIGYILIPTARFQKAFLLYGYGSNGKSTLLDVIHALIGQDNISSLSIQELSQGFKLAEITNKMANIGDDISDEYIKDSSTFKKLVTGDEITVDKKYEQPYKMRNYAKLLFACNTLPNMADKTDGMIRRLTIVPFNANFTSEDDDYDPFIIDKITTPKALSYLLNLALDGLTDVFTNSGFTEPNAVVSLLSDYEEEINNVIPFLRERGNFDGVTGKELHTEYQLWCINSTLQPYGIRKFNQEVRNRTNMGLEVEKVDKISTQVWR